MGTVLTSVPVVPVLIERSRHGQAELGELPKTSTGKIQKYGLRDAAWAGAERWIR